MSEIRIEDRIADGTIIYADEQIAPALVEVLEHINSDKSNVIDKKKFPNIFDFTFYDTQSESKSEALMDVLYKQSSFYSQVQCHEISGSVVDISTYVPAMTEEGVQNDRQLSVSAILCVMITFLFSGTMKDHIIHHS